MKYLLLVSAGVAALVILSGCATAPDYGPPGPADCVVIGGGGLAEAEGAAPMFGGSGSGRGGSLEVRNAAACRDGGVNLLHRSPNGSVVCIGAWCPSEPPAAPVSLTIDQVRELAREPGR